MISAILIDWGIFSVLLWPWQDLCTNCHDKNFPKGGGASKSFGRMRSAIIDRSSAGFF
jgi:hypothetical protein